MSTEIDVLKAKTEMLDYLTEENCTIDPELRSNEGFSLGQQVRVTVKNAASKYGLATLHSDYQDGTDNNDIRMRASGRARFDQTDSFDAYIDSPGVQQNQTKSWLDTNNEIGEFLTEEGNSPTTVCFCAPHGGAIEANTDEQAEWALSRLKNQHSKDGVSWRVCGWQDAIGAFDAWHITSTDIDPDSFPKLDSIKNRNFQYAVSFHGFSEDSIIVGGSVSADVKCSIRKAIETAVGGNYDVSIATSGAYSGTSADNFVNWLTSGGSGGIQIEQPYGARRYYGQAIAEAVADVIADLLS